MSITDNEVRFCEAEEQRIKSMRSGDEAGVKLAELRILSDLMKAQFGNATINENNSTVSITVSRSRLVDWARPYLSTQIGGEVVVIDATTGKVIGQNEHTVVRLERVFRRLRGALDHIKLH